MESGEHDLRGDFLAVPRVSVAADREEFLLGFGVYEYADSGFQFLPAGVHLHDAVGGGVDCVFHAADPGRIGAAGEVSGAGDGADSTGERSVSRTRKDVQRSPTGTDSTGGVDREGVADPVRDGWKRTGRTDGAVIKRIEMRPTR